MNKGLRIGYVPVSGDLSHPGDRWRFGAYAKARGLQFELARPEERYDVVVLSELADISVWEDYAGGKIVYDLCDSYLAVPRNHYKHRLRGPYRYLTARNRGLILDYWAAFARMCARADAVVCTTLEQKTDIEHHCSNVHIVLDVHTSVAGASKADYSRHGPLRVVWEGLPVNVPQLRSIGGALRELGSRQELELHIVTTPHMTRFLGHFGRMATADYVKDIYPRITVHAWQESAWAATIGGCDVAIIPIDLDDPFTAGKPENKLLLFWRIAMPVVTSATPAYRRAMDAAGTRLYCTTEEDWIRVLGELGADEGRCREAGLLGQRYATEHASAPQHLAAWDAVFASIGAA
jgi:hypothetical protein